MPKTEIEGESNHGFDEAARDAARKLNDGNWGKGTHRKVKVRFEVDLTVTSPGSIGTYRVILTPPQ
jgi:hypothetical protein